MKNCKVSTAIEFKSKLGFRQHDIIMIVFAKEKILLEHFVLGKRIDLYFPEHELKKDKKGHKDRKKLENKEQKKQ